MQPNKTVRFRIGIDLGGTKIAATAITPDGTVLPERRRPTPRGDYAATITALVDLASELAAGLPAHAGDAITVGVGMPGSIAPRTGLVQNANSVWLNGRPFAADLSTAMPYPIRLANDANCLALSEAHDGAGQGAASLFAVILGTGCGGGLMALDSLLKGHRHIAGEWGHTSLPWTTPDDHPAPACWCGRSGCMEVWVSGPGLAADHHRRTGIVTTAEAIVAESANGDIAAITTRERHLSRLARGLAQVVNVFDPEVIVIGGGLSRIPDLYHRLPAMMSAFIFADDTEVAVRPAKWGDASGARGAARLWPDL